MNCSGENGVSIGLLDILLVIFIVLKLTNVVAWSWVVVLIPLWIIIGVIAGVIIFAITVKFLS